MNKTQTGRKPPASHDPIDAVFSSWARSGRAEGMERGHKRGASAAFELLGLPKQGRYLDIGCGNGYSVRWALDAMDGGSALGIDVATDMVARARAASADYPNARFEQVSIMALEDEAGYDAILSVEALYYLEDPQAALGAIHGFLKPGGRFALAIDHYQENEGCHSWSDDLGLPMVLWSIDTWIAAFTAASFSDLQCHQIRSDDPNDEDWKREHGTLVIVGRRAP